MSLNPTNIEAFTHSWNPLYGCLHTTKECACADHCYASTVSSRRLNLDFRQPMYYPKRLKDVTPKQKPRVIFVGSMTDMMGKWWTDATIQKIIDRCQACPQHIFMWLTKNPHRYSDFTWPDNCWLGATVTSNKDEGEYWLPNRQRLFISHEPIMGKWTPYYDGKNLSGHKNGWIIAGCMTDGQGNPHPDYPVQVEQIRELSKTAPLLIKSPLSTEPRDKQYPPEIKAIMDTWRKQHD